MIGPFVQIVRQILETLLSFSSAIGKSREKETKRALLRLFFDLIDFEATVERFLKDVKHAVSNRNRNSLQSAVMELRTLNDQLKVIISHFYYVMRSDAKRYLLEVADYQVRYTLDKAVGSERSLLHEWIDILDDFVAEVIESTNALPTHLNPDVKLPALSEKRFLPENWKKYADHKARARAIRLSGLVEETEIWLASFQETIESYRLLVKSQVSLQDIL